MFACRNQVRAHEEVIRDRGQEGFMLQKQLTELQSELLRLRTQSTAVDPSAAPQRDNQREQDLLSQMDSLESSYQKQVAELAASLDAAKTENLTMCLEVKDVGELAQRLSNEVRSSWMRGTGKRLKCLGQGCGLFVHGQGKLTQGRCATEQPAQRRRGASSPRE